MSTAQILPIANKSVKKMSAIASIQKMHLKILYHKYILGNLKERIYSAWAKMLKKRSSLAIGWCVD